MDSQNISNNVQVQNETLRVNKIPGIISLIKEAWSILVDKKEIILGLSLISVLVGTIYNYLISTTDTFFVFLLGLFLFVVNILCYVAFVLVAKERALIFEQAISKAISILPRVLLTLVIVYSILIFSFLSVLFVVFAIVYFSIGIKFDQITQLVQSISEVTLTASTVFSFLNEDVMFPVVIILMATFVVFIATIIFSLFFVFSSIISIENGVIWKAVKSSMQLVRDNFLSVIWRIIVINIFSVVIMQAWSYLVKYIFEISNMQTYSLLSIFVGSIPVLIVTPMITLYVYRLYRHLSLVGRAFHS